MVNICLFFSSFSIFAKKFLFLLTLSFVVFLVVFLMTDLLRRGVMYFN